MVFKVFTVATGKLRVNVQDSNPGSFALEADALTTRPTRR